MKQPLTLFLVFLICTFSSYSQDSLLFFDNFKVYEDTMQKINIDGCDSTLIQKIPFINVELIKMIYFTKDKKVDQIAYVIPNMEMFDFLLRLVKSFAIEEKWNEYYTTHNGIRLYYRFSPQRLEFGKYVLWIDTKSRKDGNGEFRKN